MTLARYLFAVVTSALVGFLACALYATQLNPELQFWRQALARKRSWMARPAAEGPRVLICGGSSAAFAFDPLRFEQVSGIPCGNLALFAGLGTPVMIEMAQREARAGDTLVLAVEPGLFTVPMEFNAVGQQLLFAEGGPRGFSENSTGVARQTIWSRLNLLRPGGYFVFTVIARRLLGRPPYAYSMSDVSEAGWLTTAYRRKNSVNPGILGRLSPDGRLQLDALASWGKAHGVRVVAALPRGLVAPESTGDFHRNAAAFVLDLMEYFPVIRDPDLGMDANPGDFADTPAHLVARVAETYTEAMARAVKAGDFWDRAAVEKIASGSAER